MSLQNVLGQPQATGILRRILQEDRLTHTYLFFGPDSVGKKRAGYEFAKSLICESTGPLDACDACSSCRRIDQGLHPDVFFLEPETTSTGREAWIKIETIRDLQKKLAFLPYEGKTKVVLIDSAERINPQATNAFLKTLEEPPSQTVLILISSNPQQILPTVISRCQGIRFQPLTVPTIQTLLEQMPEEEKFDPEEVALRASRAGGSLERAFDADLMEWAEIRRELATLLLNISFDRMDLLFSFTRNWAKSPLRIPQMLKEISGLLRDAALLQIGCPAKVLLNQDMVSELQQLSSKYNRQSLANLNETVHQTRLALAGNANVQLALETLLLDFCEALPAGRES